MNRTPAKCPQCRARFTPEERGIRIHPACVDAWYEAHRQKQAKKAEAKRKKDVASDRRETKAKLQAIKPRSKWLAECQAIANSYARTRDRLAGHGCISCGARPEQRYGGSMDGGHFRSTGSAPNLRLRLDNIYLQCVKCNRYLGSNAVEYRKSLVARKGLNFVEMIESDQSVLKADIAYLKRYKIVVGRRLKTLLKRLSSCNTGD